MRRDPANPLKLLVQRLCKERGMTLQQLYAKAGVNRAYLSEVPAHGWRPDKMTRMAVALGVSLETLQAASANKATDGADEVDMMAMAIKAAIEAAPGETTKSSKIAVKLIKLQQWRASSSEPPLSHRALAEIARLLLLP